MTQECSTLRSSIMLVAEFEESDEAVRFVPRELRVVKDLLDVSAFLSSYSASLRIQRCTSLTNLLTVQAQPCERVSAVATSDGKHPPRKASMPAKVSPL